MQEYNDFAENENSWETDKEKFLKSPILILRQQCNGTLPRKEGVFVMLKLA